MDDNCPFDPDDTPCAHGTLVGRTSDRTYPLQACCRKWSCERCGKRNARRLAKRIMKTPVRRFITFTIAPNPNRTPIQELDLMNAAWRTIWKRIRRKQGAKARGYIKVVERTKQGTPHLHIGADCGFISQATLSRWWEELTGSYVVDIRAVHTVRGLARYLAKYLSKDTDALPGRRKYSATARWLPPPERFIADENGELIRWRFEAISRVKFVTRLLVNGYTRDGDWFISPWASG